MFTTVNKVDIDSSTELLCKTMKYCEVSIDGFSGLKSGMEAVVQVETHDGDNQEPLTSALKAAIQASMDMLERLKKVTVASSMVALAKGELKEYKELPSSLHPIAHCLQVPWDKELADLNEKGSEVPFLVSKAEMAEAAINTLEAATLRDTIFDSVRQKCSSYKSSFINFCDEAMNQQSQALTSAFADFAAKYEELEGAVEQWAIKEVEWMFMEDNTEEVKADLEKVKRTKKQLVEFMKSLDAISKYDKSQSDLAKLAKLAVSLKGQINEKANVAGKIATILAFSDLVLSNRGKADYDKHEKFTQKNFGLGVESLPKILAEKVAECKKKVDDPKREPEKIQTPSSEKTKRSKRESDSQPASASAAEKKEKKRKK